MRTLLNVKWYNMHARFICKVAAAVTVYKSHGSDQQNVVWESMTVPTPQEIRDQQELLETHRRTLAIYLRQQAITGPPYAPPAVIHGIRESRDNIQRIKSILRAWKVAVEDHPDDEESPTTSLHPGGSPAVHRKSIRPLGIGKYVVKIRWLIYLGVVGIGINIIDVIIKLSNVSSFSIYSFFEIFSTLWLLRIIVFMLPLLFGITLHVSRFTRIGWFNIETDTHGKIYLTKVQGICPRCAAKLFLAKVGSEDDRKIMVLCNRNPRQHRWEFDPTQLPDLDQDRDCARSS